jgi:putative ABC transport system permease protein
MSLRALWSRIRGTLRRDDTLEQEMEREMAFHLDMATKRNVARGMPEDAAARQATLAFGSLDATREDARDAYRARVAENFVADVRFAIRSLIRAPSFALAAILTVALGIGASTAIFTVVDAVLLRPIPIPHPEDFTYVGWVWNKGGEIPALSGFQYEFVRQHNRSFEALATFQTEDAHLGDPADVSPPVRGLRVSGDFFRTIGFLPRLGRAFDDRELAEGTQPLVILGDALWRTRFGADSSIIGRQIRLDSQLRTVIGVLPDDFRFPPAPDYDGYLIPFAFRADPVDEGHNTNVIARLRHGTSDVQRAADLEALSRDFQREYPGLAEPNESFKLFAHRDVYVGGVRRTLWVLFGAVSLVLLIACANTATLLLVRASAREREIAVRASIGAGPGRILQQLLTEGLMLSVLSSSLGVLLGMLALRGFLAAAPTVLPAGMQPELDTRTLGYAVALSIGAGLVFGFAAAVPSFRLRLHSGVLSGARGTTGGGSRTRETLVFLETASAVVLLAGATLLVASFTRLVRVDPGFDADHVIALRLGQLPAYYDAERRDQLVDRLLERVRNAPGVEYAAAAPNLPLERGMNFPVDTRENPELAIGAVELRFVSPDYFATLGVPLLAGRDFGRGDVQGNEPVAIVNQEFARRFWNTASPIGRAIQIGHYKDHWLNPGADHQTRVIGVAADMHELGLDRKPRPTVLVPRTQQRDGTPVLLVRGAAPQLATMLRRAAVAEEPQLVPTIEPLSAVVSRSVAGPRFRTLLIGAFAGSALLLAAIGIYGVIASVVQQRTREIGIRLSLGASGAAVALGVARRCLTSVSAGAVVGLLAFAVLRRFLASMLYDTSTGDPRMLAIAVSILALVAALAAWIPARRASHVDPAITLRLD